MPIAATCPHCGKTYTLADALAGKKARCKSCQNVFAISGPPVEIAARSSSTGAAAPAAPPPRPQEVSAGGVKIVRAPATPAPKPSGPPARTPYSQQIAEHINQTIGPVSMVFHEHEQDAPTGIHCNLFIVPPTNQEPSEEHPLGTAHFTIITAGLSGRPQNVPDDARDDISPLQELMIALPGNWPGLNADGTIDDDVLQQEENWWPIGVMKMIAQMPTEYDTFLAPGVTVPNGEEAEPYAPNTKLGCMMAFLPMLSPNAAQLQIDDKTRIDFYALWPLYPEEMKLKLDKGLEPLLKKLMEAEVSELIVVDRANLCKKKGWFR